jgi:hypothetical protein
LDKFCLFSDARAEKFGNPKFYDCKDPGKKTHTEIKPNPSKNRVMHEGDNASF